MKWCTIYRQWLLKAQTRSKSWFVSSKVMDDLLELWHRQLGHVNFQDLLKLSRTNSVRGMSSLSGKHDGMCKSYDICEQTQVVHSVTNSRWPLIFWSSYTWTCLDLLTPKALVVTSIFWWLLILSFFSHGFIFSKRKIWCFWKF